MLQGLMLLVGCDHISSPSPVPRPNVEADSFGSAELRDQPRGSISDLPVEPSNILDPSYNFTPSSDNSETLNQRFPIRDGQTEIALLKDAKDAFAVRNWLLQQAKQSVRIQSYIWSGDEAGWHFTEQLILLKKKGIDVRVTVDPFSNFRASSQGMFLQLERSGIDVVGYDPLYMDVLKDLTKQTDFVAWAKSHNQRVHDKLFIVDHEVPGESYAIVGGTNLANEYFRVQLQEPQSNWRDQDVVLRDVGPDPGLIQEITRTFEENVAHYRLLENNRNQAVSWSFVSELITKALLALPATAKPSGLNPKKMQILNEYLAEPISLNWQKTRIRFLQSVPWKNEFHIYDAYLELIRQAKREIVIANAYFVPPAAVRAALVEASLRGVQVRVLTNGPEANDFPVVSHAGRSFYKQFLTVNIESKTSGGSFEIYEWGGDKVFKNGEGLYHSKWIVADRTSAILGSFNLDARSRDFNSEVVVIFEQALIAAELVDMFENDIGPTHSTAITLAMSANFEDPETAEEKLRDLFARSLIPLL